MCPLTGTREGPASRKPVARRSVRPSSTGSENRRGLNTYREFESHSLRHLPEFAASSTELGDETPLAARRDLT